MRGLWGGVLCALGVVACDGNVLVVADAGVVVDAGFVDGGVVDAGFVDAGFVDAGIVDAGVVDAGTERCVFPDPEVIPFVCEGDEDVCDPMFDLNDFIPGADIVAVWSRIEGDEFIIDVRYAGFPFRGIPQVSDLVVESTTNEDVLEYGVGFCGERLEPEHSSGEAQLDCVGGTDEFQTVPLACIGFSEEIETLMGCRVSLGVSQPVIRYRWPLLLVATEPLTRFAVYARKVFSAQGADCASDAADPFLTSRGGAPDAEDTYLPLCGLDCDQLGGRTEIR